MKIAMVGTKGVPAQWGGIEKYIEEVGKRLVDNGHEVTVFGSKWFLTDFHGNEYCGMRIRRVPTLHHQATDALSNAFFATLLVAIGRYDVVNFHGYASYFFIPLLKIFGKRTVVTIHAIESNWDNPKYHILAKKVLQAGLKIGIYYAHSVTTVAEHLRDKLAKEYSVSATVLPSGIDIVKTQSPKIIRDMYGLHGFDYILFLGRIDQIKRIDWLLDLKKSLGNNLHIVIAGGAQDAATQLYLLTLIRTAGQDKRIIFTGPVQGRLKAELLSNCLFFVNPSSNEGLPITVFEAISFGRCCLASDIYAHREVIRHGYTGFLFPSDNKIAFLNLARKLMIQPKETLASMGDLANKELKMRYNWEKTARGFDIIYRESILD
jgi:glycosyltransferase involved in cell wall biosynthesis